MRSFLTMLGIIIGIASIISIVSTIKGTNEQIKQNLIGAGNNVVKIQVWDTNGWEYEFQYNGIPDGVPTVSDSVRDKIKELNNVEDVAVYNRRNGNDSYLFYQNTSLSGCETFGVESDYFSIMDYKIKKGRGFVSSDYSEFKSVMILNETASKTLFNGADPLGKTVEYNGSVFSIVGVVAESTQYEPVINSEEEYWTYAESNNSGKIFIPKTKWCEIYSYDEPETVAVKTTSTEAMSSVGKSAADILNDKVTSETVKYQADDVLQTAAELQSLSSATNNQLIWIASISLLVGGIGVMNIMLVSVTERTKEIGLKKAIGAKKKRILWQFLTEAAVLTSIGGLIGIVVGIGLAQLISSVAEIPVSISIPAIILSVVFSMAIGIIFGLLPSVKASNLNPIDALRYE